MTDERDAGPDAVTRSAPEATPQREPHGVAERLAAALGGAAEYVGAATSTIGAAVEATARRFEERPGARVRRVRRLGHVPLPYLHDVRPDARRRTERDLGVQTIEVSDIAGTAVGGAGQRGGDFLPLRPFRTGNWSGRWQRLSRASESLAVLPPIDVLRLDDRYWVVDGHNRVAMALYTGQASIDADVVELVDPTTPSKEPAESFASLAEDSRELRAAVRRPRSSGAEPVEPSESR